MIKSVRTPEQKVEAYLRRHSHGSLKFGDSIVDVYGDCRKMKKVSADRSNYSLDDMISFVLEMARQRESFYSRGSIYSWRQCRGGANRSAMDIWRHIKYYQPDIDLFSVMRGLFNYDGNEYVRQVCPTVHKRVFYINYDNRNYNDYNKDEFSLLWDDWEKIGS